MAYKRISPQPIIEGGTNKQSYTTGSVLFFDGTSIQENNANFFWDNANSHLSVGSVASTVTLNGNLINERVSSRVTNGILNAGYAGHRYSDSANSAASLLLVRSRNTEAAPIVVQNNDRLAEIAIGGFDGTDYALGAEIHVSVDGASVGANSMPSRIEFLTSPASSQTPIVGLKIDSSQLVTASAGVSVTTGNVNIVAGNLLLPTTSATAGQIQINSTRFLHGFGTSNTFVGSESGNFTTSGTGENSCLGNQTGTNLTTGFRNTFVGNVAGFNHQSGSNNTFIGRAAGLNNLSGTTNVYLGSSAAQNSTSGNENTIIGSFAAVNGAAGLLTGSFNVIIGRSAANAFTSSESSNVIIRNFGVAGDNNTIRIGTQGSGNSQQNRCFVAGIASATNGGASFVPFIETTTGQISQNPGGTVTLNTGTNQLDVSTDASATTVNLATGAAAKTVTLGSTNSTSTTTVQSGSGGVAINTSSNSNITLAPNGTGIVSVTASPIVPSTDRADSLGSTTNSWDNVYCDGVSFDDGGNILQTYDINTFTPSLLGETSAGTTTYSVRTGVYTKIGRLVTVQIVITISAATGTGNVNITGLPFTSSATTNREAMGSCVWSGSGWTWPTNTTYLIADLSNNSTIIKIRGCGSAASSAFLQMTNAAASCKITLTYLTDTN